jgi:hypothetical protein
VKLRPAVVATVVAGALGLAGCSRHGPSTESFLAASTTTTVAAPVIPGPPGRFLSKAGENSLDAGLYELTFGPPRLEALTSVRRVTSIGACPTAVVVAAAQPEVGYDDHLQSFRQGRFGPVEGLGTPRAFYPVLAPDCRVLYVEPPLQEDDPDHLHIWDPAAKKDTVVATAAEFGGTSWGPGGAIAFVERSRTRPGVESVDRAVVILTAKGQRRELPPPATDTGYLLWGATNWMAFGHHDVTILLQPDTGERHELAGWVPLAWSPDGKQLLVAEPRRPAPKGVPFSTVVGSRKLGLVDISDLGTVKPLGEAPMPVLETVWLPAGSDPVGAASG